MRPSISLALLLPAVSALPTSNLIGGVVDEVFCTVNVIVILALKQDAGATSYCASYLSIPTITKTVTLTETPPCVYTTVPVTITGDPVTETVTLTQTTSTDITTTETATEIVTQTTTQVTATKTLTCLTGAYTASPPVVTIQKRHDGIQEQPKPTGIPPSWGSHAISKACECFSIPTPCVTKTVTKTLPAETLTLTSTNTLIPTTTVTDTDIYTETITHTESTTTTATTTLTAQAEATTLVSNGLMYRKYTHSYNANLANPGFISSTFKTLTPDWTGHLETLSFSNWEGNNQVDLTLPDHASFPATQAAVLAQGFFIARETGTYTLSSSGAYVDNWGYLWIGDVAYSAWDDSNTAFKAVRVGAGPYTGGSTTVNLTAGSATPLTWLWVNGGGAAQSYFTVTSPSGVSTTDTTGYFVQACSNTVFA